MEEIWKDIPGYEGYYQVSNTGKVKSLDGYYKRKYPIILKPSLHRGYYRVVLCVDQNRKSIHVHQLVMLAFTGEPNGLQINHINGIKTDNRLCNLEYVTQSENMKHAYRIGLEKPCDNGLKKAVAMIKNGIRTEYPSIREMCRANNFDRKKVQRILRRAPNYNSIKGYTIEYI